MFNKFLESYLISKSAELSQQMQEMIGGIVPIYNTAVDAAMDESLGDAYAGISSIVDDWMEFVLQMELFEYDGNVAHAYLVMPYDTIEYCLEYNVSGVAYFNDSSSQFSTPIGRMDYFVYRCICDIKDNPVQVFYRWIKQQCDLAHILIQLSPEGYVPQEVRDKLDNGEGIINWDSSDAEGFADDVLNDAVLGLAGINDPLKLCSLDTCVSHIDEFFDSYGFHEGHAGQEG